jgi:hypothetical protein
MDHNPYSPPAASVADVVSAGTLYSPRQIFAASFLGSPIAAAWLVHRNFKVLKPESRSLRTVWLGLAATVAVFVAAFYLPKHFPNALLPLAYSFAIYQYASFLFKTSYQQHLAAGGRAGSWWRVIGVSLLALLILMGVLLMIAFAAPGLFPNE